MWLGLKNVALNPDGIIIFKNRDISLEKEKKIAEEWAKRWEKKKEMPKHNEYFKLCGIRFQFKKVENGQVLP